ncbi:hypothetical protein AABB24_035713, partial [Solanum stoloniferum]
CELGVSFDICTYRRLSLCIYILADQSVVSPVIFRDIVLWAKMSSISSWDGTITSTQFHNAASTFSEIWNNFDLGFPHWSWINCPNKPGFAATKLQGYLSLENMILPRTTEEECVLAGIEDLTCSSEDLFNDTAILVLKDSKERHHYDFHVIYSSSFRVPVLYFRAYCNDGEALAIEDLEKDFPAYTAQELAVSKWTFITRESTKYMQGQPSISLLI